MLLKGGKIIPKLAYKRIFTLEKEKRGEGDGKKNEKKIGIYRGKVRCYVSHANSGEIEKKKRNIARNIAFIL